jgi:hypothetical protein
MSDPDWWARGIAAAGLGWAMGFNVVKEWMGGRRVHVTISDELINSVDHIVVSATNGGRTPASVVDWGVRVTTGRNRFTIWPPDTGPTGPESLPARLIDTLDPLGYSKDEFLSEVREHLTSGRLKVRGFVKLANGRKKLSKRRAAIVVDL